MSEAERKRYIAGKIAERVKIQKEISRLANERRSHIETQLEKSKDGGKNAFGQKVYDAIRSQAAEKSIHYTDDLAAH